jgi:hypothetical protein
MSKIDESDQNNGSWQSRCWLTEPGIVGYLGQQCSELSEQAANKANSRMSRPPVGRVQRMIMMSRLSQLTRAAGLFSKLVFAVLVAFCLMVVSIHGEILCSSSTASSVTLTWTAPTDADGISNATQYDLRYSTSPITDQNWPSATEAANTPTPKPSGGEETVAVTGLRPSTNYYFAIKSADAMQNWSPLSSVVSRSTISSGVSTPPEAITSLSAVSTSPTEVALRWTAPQTGTGGTVSAYIVQYSHDSITTSTLAAAARVISTTQPKEPGQQELMTISGLDTSATYHFVVRSRNSNFVWSGISNSATNGTGEDSPSDGFTYVFPNPFRVAETPNVTFAAVPAHSSLVLLTVSGDPVMQWTDNSGSDIIWNGTNQSGEAVSSGVYLWFVEGTKTKGKLIVIR